MVPPADDLDPVASCTPREMLAWGPRAAPGSDTKFENSRAANDTTDVIGRGKPRFPAYGYVGLAIMIAAEVLLFRGNQFVGHWMTPIVWTGYLLFIDALVYKVSGRSLLMNDRLEFLAVAIISIGSWWLFELYNAPRFWNSDLELWWHYHNLEPNLWLRRVGYDWAFATITPALMETAQLFQLTIFKQNRNAPKIKFNKSLLAILIAIGSIGVIVPLLYPNEWFAPVIWLSFILMVDPINALLGLPSITGDLALGNWNRLLALLASGLLCGFLWEFWNYWALSKWTYTVPYFGHVKIFEMPVLGFLGFPPFAVECWAIYIFARWLLQPGLRQKSIDEIFVSSR
ncbi:MAG TPA: hypothetical protein VHP99_10705 [Pyrinomonadaceae bacterium]|nr:hypothetical protein [Pyrinomonadaceae bacterium]